MRDMLRYPLTKEEIIEHLEQLQREAVAAERIGDLTIDYFEVAIRAVKEVDDIDVLMRRTS